jgi:hypothetical protein
MVLFIFFLIILYNLNKGILVLSFLIPIEGFSNQYGLYYGISLIKVIGIFLLLNTCINTFNIKSYKINNSLFLYVLLLLWAVYSMAWTSLSYTNFSRLFSLVQYVVLLLVFTSHVNKVGYIINLKAFLFGAFISIIVSIIQTCSNDCYVRLAGGNKGPNHTAVTLIMSIVFALIITKKEPNNKYYYFAYCVIAAVAIVWTKSMTGLFGLLIIATYVIWYSRRAIKFFYIITLSTFIYSYYDFLRLYLMQKFYGSFVDRLFYWDLALSAAKDNISGSGIGSWSLIYRNYLSLDISTLASYPYLNLEKFDTPQSVHNSYLEILVELGFIGLILYMSVIVIAFTKTFNFRYIKDVDSQINNLFNCSITLMAIFLAVLANYMYPKLLVFILANIIIFIKYRKNKHKHIICETNNSLP